MATINENIHIDAPPQAVFDFLRDPHNWIVVASSFRDVHAEEPSLQKGSVVSATSMVAGRKLAFTMEITECVENERIAYQSIEAAIPFSGIWEFEAEGDGTRYRSHQEIGSFGGVFGKLADTVVTKMYTRDVRANLENLKAVLETR